MLKVLIADDEVKVIQLIEYLVDWNAFGMEIAFRINDGKKALDTILAQRPDVVITDIRMPVINGIELVSRTRQAGLSPYFVIISGYSEFEYAQKAIQMGVEDYLLKPLKKKDLEQVLTRIRDKYRLQEQTDEEKSDLLSRLSDRMKKAKDTLLTDIIVKGSRIPVSMSAAEFLEEYGFSLENADMECLVTHIYTGYPSDSSVSEEEYRFILPKLQEALEARLAPFAREVVSTIYKKEIITLLVHNQISRTILTDQLHKLKINVLNYRSIYPGLQVAIGMSSRFTAIDDLPAAYREARSSLIRRFTQRDSMLLECGPADPAEKPESKLITPSDRKALLQKLELLDADAFSTVAESCFDRIRKESRSPQMTAQAYASLCETFSFGLQSLDQISPDLLLASEELAAYFDRLYSWEEVRDQWLATASRILSSYSEERRSLEDKPIRMAKQYIQEHYNEAISLETVSSEVGFNPAYFSTIFKKATGQNFMDYVKEVRINSAKDLLIHTSLDVAEIAQSVGYSDIKYFSRLFRKATNLTPSDYRKLYG